MTVTFETVVWEEDWEFVLKTDRLEKMIRNCHFDFDKKVVFVNNVSDRFSVEKQLTRLVSSGLISSFTFTEDVADEALKYLDVSFKMSDVGYYFSLAEFVSAYKLDTDFVVHFKGDAIATEESEKTWLKDCLELLESDQQVKSCNPVWNRNFSHAKTECHKDTDKFFLGKGFSDQTYVMRSSDLKGKIYNFNHSTSEAFPKYAGESFEKRLNSWLWCNNFFRAVHKRSSYFHQNIRKQDFLKTKLDEDFNSWLES